MLFRYNDLVIGNFRKDANLRSARATCVNLSVCGNFIMIGYSSGHVDRSDGFDKFSVRFYFLKYVFKAFTRKEMFAF